MLDTACSEVVWRVPATHSTSFPVHSPSRASQCAITFQLESTVRADGILISIRDTEFNCGNRSVSFICRIYKTTPTLCWISVALRATHLLSGAVAAAALCRKMSDVWRHSTSGHWFPKLMFFWNGVSSRVTTQTVSIQVAGDMHSVLLDTSHRFGGYETTSTPWRWRRSYLPKRRKMLKPWKCCLAEKIGLKISLEF